MNVRSYGPLAAHVLPTIVIGFGFVIPGSPIAGINEYTVGFAGSILGTIVAYHTGVRRAARPTDPRRSRGGGRHGFGQATS
ncbi:MAG: hypothetical protein OEU32_05580 [Acidimicrobiia bacterium]|nr:hypothetical protein [Acidimicrobiia bacterium]